MAILVQTIINQCNSLLDSEGSERYTFTEDFLPAITAANQYVISIFNAAFAKNKLSPENLKELAYMRCWQTSLYSRFAFDSTIVGHNLWTILAIHPKITCIVKNVTWPVGTFVLPPATVESVYRSDISFRDSNYSAKRVTAEEWSKRNINPFVAGSSLITCPELITYAYSDFSDYVGGYNLTNNKFEIEVSPDINGELVAMRYLRLPTAPTVITDSLDFPPALTNMIVQLVMRFIGIKQSGIETYNIADKEIDELTKLLS